MISSSQLSIAERIIVPLDVSTEADAIALLDRLPQVTFWKVGLELFVSSGSRILEILKAREKRIFLDLKFHDIPNTMAGACRAAAGYGVDLVTIHAAAGQAALKASQTAAEEGSAAAELPTPNLIAVTLLTSINSRALAFELKVPLELNDYTLQMALIAEESGLAGVVCSPQEVMQLRNACRKGFVFVCPGVRPTWAEAGDQQRSLTPAAAIKAGADYLVIGRPITSATDPAAAFAQIVQEIEQSANEK
jgi:orotidine-5'-phosphate decarboxylase